MELWEKNIKALAEKNEKLAEEIRQVIEQEQHTNVFVKELDNGNRILGINYNNRIWNLNSRLDPEGAADLYVERYKIKPFYRYFVFGFSDGRVIRKLLEKCDNSNAVVVCEPNKEILAEAMLQYDLKDLFLDKRILVCVSEHREIMYSFLFYTVDHSYIKLIEFCLLPGYDVLYTEECQKYMDEVLARMEGELLKKVTYVYFNRKTPHAMLFNMQNMIKQRNLAQIKKEIEKVDIKGVPAIVVSAGPSLDKNIKELKKAEGKAFIIVVDAALRTVLRENVRPDIVCSIDAEAPERFFEGAENEDIIWSCVRTSNPWFVKKYGKKVFYHNEFFLWWDALVQNELEYNFPHFEVGGSVATAAFQVARYLGFTTIIFAGLDLAFTGGHSHTSGIKGVLGENDEYIKSRKVVQVEDADGNFLETDYQMYKYKEWFESTLKEKKENLRVIDATEGGAKIEGMIIKPLKQSIEEECKKEIHFYEMIQKIPMAFDERQQKYLYQKLESLAEMKENFREQIKLGIQKEEKLLKLLKSGKATKEKISDGLEKTIVFNRKLEQHTFIECISLYATKEEFELEEEIYTKEDMEVEEVIERSIRLHRSYLDAIPLFEEDFAEALNTQ